MRSSFTLATLVLASALGLGTTMCGSSDDGGSPSGTTAQSLAQGRFRGVLAGAGDLSGVLDVTVTSTATTTRAVHPLDVASPYSVSGSLNLNIAGLGPVMLTGTLNLANNTVTFSGMLAGGAVTFTGTYANGVIEGTATTPRGAATFRISNESLGDLRTYCGSFNGGLSGRWSVLVTGGQAGAVFATADGRVGSGTGTLQGDLVTLTLRPDGSATGRQVADILDGTYRYAGVSGAFSTSQSACAALVPAGPGQDGGVTDAAVEAGPPGAPEPLHTVPGAVPVGHLAIANGKIFYALNHTYFSQTVTIGSVNADGTAPVDVIPTNVPATTPKTVVAGLTATAAKVYYLGGVSGADNDTNLFSVATAGGTVTDHGLVGNASNLDYASGVSRLLNDGTSIFVSYAGSSSSAIRSFGLDGSPLATLAGRVGATGMGFDGTDLLFGDFDGLQRVAKALTPAPMLAATSSEYGSNIFVVNIASDADNVYFVGNSSNSATLFRKPKGGGAVAPVIAATPGRARGLALVDGQLYFTLGSSSGGQQGMTTGSLVRVAKSSTNATPTVIGPANLFDVLTDGTYVYYGNGAVVQRLHK